MNPLPFLLLASCDAHTPSFPSLPFLPPALLTAALSSGRCQWYLSGIALIAQWEQPQFPILLLPLAVWRKNAFWVCLQFSINNATLH